MLRVNLEIICVQVHDMMDDIAEQQDVAKEISEAISNPVAFGSVILIIDNKPL